MNLDREVGEIKVLVQAIDKKFDAFAAGHLVEYNHLRDRVSSVEYKIYMAIGGGIVAGGLLGFSIPLIMAVLA